MRLCEISSENEEYSSYFVQNKFPCDKENIRSNNSDCWIVSGDGNGRVGFNVYGGLSLMQGGFK